MAGPSKDAPESAAGATITNGPDLLDIEAVRHFFGGTRPLHAATVYRGIAAGVYPRPLRISANCNRWLRNECEEALRRIIEGPRELRQSPRVRSRVGYASRESERGS